MRLVLLALYDLKIGAFMTPFFAQTPGAAMRQLSDMVNGKPDEPLALHPEDYKLYHIGVWADDGFLEVKKSPELVCECLNLKTGVK